MIYRGGGYGLWEPEARAVIEPGFARASVHRVSVFLSRNLATNFRGAGGGLRKPEKKNSSRKFRPCRMVRGEDVGKGGKPVGSAFCCPWVFHLVDAGGDVHIPGLRSQGEEGPREERNFLKNASLQAPEAKATKAVVTRMRNLTAASGNRAVFDMTG